MKLDELAKLEQAATKGPWEWRGKSDTLHSQDNKGAYSYGPSLLKLDSEYVESGHVTDADMDLIAAARNALPALIRVAKAAKEALIEIASTGYPRNSDGKYDKDGKWGFGEACPNPADAECLLKAHDLLDAALQKIGESK